MTRLCLLAFIATTLACAGLPPSTHPLYIARPADSTAPIANPTLAVEMNSVVLQLPASTLTGCFDLVGDYVRRGEAVDVTLRQASPTGSCSDTQRPFITRIGPLPPGSYEITVTLDGKTLIRAERATIS
jgi:hypothetical protein